MPRIVNKSNVPIPEIVRSSDRRFAIWGNTVRKAIIALASQKSVFLGPSRRPFRHHPFQLFPYWDGTTPKLRIAWGAVLSPVVSIDSTGDRKVPGWQMNSTTLAGGGELIGNPAGSAPGSLTLAASTTYGVWLALATAGAAAADKGYFQGEFQSTETLAVGPDTISVDSTYVDSTDYGTKAAATADRTYTYIGKIVVGAANTAFAVTQWLRSDVFAPWLGMPVDILSSDADQSLTTGADGGIYYDAP